MTQTALASSRATCAWSPTHSAYVSCISSAITVAGFQTCSGLAVKLRDLARLNIANPMRCQVT